MAKRRSRFKNSHLIAFMIVAVLLSYAVPTLFGMKSPRLTPRDALTPLQVKELEARALRDEIALLEDRVAVLSARNALAEKAQALAVEKTQQAKDAFDEAESAALQANDAFDAADLKEREAEEALRYARMTEAQARDALKLATDKETAAKLALVTATRLQQQANKALMNAQKQSQLANQTLAEIEALEEKIAELNADLEKEAKERLAKSKDTKKADETATDEDEDYANRRLPKAGKAVVVFEDRLVPTHNKVSIPSNLSQLDVKERKAQFITLLLPLIIKANDTIGERRTSLIKAIAEDDKATIARLMKLYGLAKFDGSDEALHEELLNRIAPVPTSLALAQAAVESGWGQSRFAKEGNALFGQWAWSADAGIKPLDASNSRAVIRSFATIYDSVFAYIHNLNTHYAYQDFRDERAIAIANGEVPSGLKLARYLTAYAELGQKYVYVLQAMILHNRFDIYESYQLAR